MILSRILPAILILLLINSLDTKAQEYKWLHTLGTVDYQDIKTATDEAGYVYVSGAFQDGDSFGGIILHTTHYAAPYLAKYDRKGNVRWALSLAPNQHFSIVDLAVTRIGEAYILGSFTDTLQLGGQLLLNPNLQEENNYNPGYFLAKYKRKGQGIEYVRLLDGLPNEIGTDESGNVFICGNFIKEMELGGTELTDTSEWDSHTFLARYSAAGQFSWVKKLINSTNFTYPQLSVSDKGVTTISWTVAYLTPLRNGVAKQSSAALTEDYSNGSYIGRYSASGNRLWIKQPYQGQGTLINQASMLTDEFGRIYLTGSFSGQMVFGSDTLKSEYIPAYVDEYGDEYPESYRTEMYVAMLNKRGEPLWARQMESSSYSFGVALALGQDGGVWVAGSFYDTARFSGQTIVSDPSSISFYVARLNGSGSAEWISTATANSTSSTTFLSLSTDNRGNCYLAGLSGAGATFGSHTNSGVNYYNPFLVRVTDLPDPATRERSQIAVGTSIENTIQVSAYPNPFVDQISLSLKSTATGTASITVTDLAGRVVKTNSLALTEGTSQVLLDLSSQPKGVYLVTVTSGEQQAVSRLIKQ